MYYDCFILKFIPAPVVSKKPQLSEYEMIREKNIAEQRLLFLQHMKSLSSAAVARPPQDKRPRKPRSMDTMGRKRVQVIPIQ